MTRSINVDQYNLREQRLAALFVQLLAVLCKDETSQLALRRLCGLSIRMNAPIIYEVKVRNGTQKHF